MATWTESEILDRLSERYSGDCWAFFRKVPNGTGMAKSRTCDALAMGLWPSKGLHIHGHEIKCSRSDWLREIQDPSKAESFAQYCHYWWIVAPKGCVELVELPATWGLIAFTKTSLRVARPATITEPKPISHEFLAGVFRAACQQSPESRLRQACEREYSRGWREGRASVKSEAVATVESIELRKVKEQIAEFQEASGLEFPAWYGGRELGEAVRLVRDARVKDLCSKLRHAISWYENVQNGAAEALQKLEEAQKAVGAEEAA